jgi:CHASE3 domain sensor protein
MAGPENTIDPLPEQGRMTPFGERTFLGSRRVSTRLRLFVFFVVFAFGGTGGIFYYADKTLNLSDQRNAEASIIVQRAANIEKQIWQLRNTEREFTLSKDPKHIGVYQSIFKSLNERLSLLKLISSTKTIKEHIATVNDGITQHAKAFEQLNHHNNKKLNARLKKLSKILDESAKAAEEHLTNVTIASHRTSL